MDVRRSHLIIDASFLDHGNENVVSLSDDLHTFRGYLSQNSNGDSRSGERVAHNEVLVDTELAAERAYFVLEKLEQAVSRSTDMCIYPEGLWCEFTSLRGSINFNWACCCSCQPSCASHT